jgi:arsenite-transporting ATPase
MNSDTGQNIPPFLQHGGLRLLLFSGKGGVGKTSCAVAAALKLSRENPETSILLVSTDPAHSIQHSIAKSPLPANLSMVELDAGRCLVRFKEKYNQHLHLIAQRGTFLDDEDITRFMDLSLPGLDELMAFLKISRWLKENRYDRIIVDTAPTGHTLRLISMPALLHRWLDALDTMLAKHRYMVEAFRGSYQPDETDRFLLDLSMDVRKMQRLLTNKNLCCFLPVMLADEMSIRETELLMRQLKNSRIPISGIVINRLGGLSDCPVCKDRRSRQYRLLQTFAVKFQNHALWTIPLFAQEIRDQKPLELFWEQASPLDLPQTSVAIDDSGSYGPLTYQPGAFPPIREEFLLFAGKGGVGKTSLACATAIHMAAKRNGKDIFLFSTDPAHSLSDCLGIQVGPSPVRVLPGLVAMEIDAQSEFDDLKQQYVKEIETLLATLSPSLDLAFDKNVMQRLMDLSPPGLDEVMALTLAMEYLSTDQYGLYILDAAPTGHLVRLLEMPEIIDQWLKAFFNLFLKYKRVFRLPGISKRMISMSKELKHLRNLFQAHKKTAVMGVTILTEMAFEETRNLAAACDRMGMTMPSLFLNLATSDRPCAFCSTVFHRESRMRQKFEEAFPEKHKILVYLQPELRGIEQLRQMGEALFQQDPF